MILDYENLLTPKAGQDLAGGAATTVTPSSIDTNPNEDGVGVGATGGRNIGGAPTINLFAQTVEAFAGGTSVDIQVIQSAAALLTAPDVIVRTGAVVTASLVAGKAFQFILQPDSITKRYLGMQFTTVGTYTGTDRIVAGVIWDLQTNFSDWPAITGYENIP